MNPVQRLCLLALIALDMILASYTDVRARGLIGANVEQHVQAVEAGAAGMPFSHTPPMGYNDWNVVHCAVTERLIEQTARSLVSSGLAAEGYRFVNIDDCWAASARTKQHDLLADPMRFPHGIRALARYVHSLGLQLGLYADAGTATCQGRPGSFGYELRDARTFASWGVDYLKEDWCHIPYKAFPDYTHDQVAELLFSRMEVALERTRRPIVLSLSGAGDSTIHMWRWGRRIATLWRTTPDIVDNWRSILSILDANEHHVSAARIGHWNDPDMLEVGNGGMTAAEDRAHFSLWSIMAAPLLIGTNVTSMSRATRATLSNRRVIAVDQDPLGMQGRVVARLGTQEILAKPLANGDHAVVLLNRGSRATTITAGFRLLGLKAGRAHVVRNLWTGQTFLIKQRLSAFVPGTSAIMLRIGR